MLSIMKSGCIFTFNMLPLSPWRGLTASKRKLSGKHPSNSLLKFELLKGKVIPSEKKPRTYLLRAIYSVLTA